MELWKGCFGRWSSFLKGCLSRFHVYLQDNMLDVFLIYLNCPPNWPSLHPPYGPENFPRAWFFRACWRGGWTQNKVIFVGSLLALNLSFWDDQVGVTTWIWNEEYPPNHGEILLILDGKPLANQLTWWLCHFFAQRFNLLGGGLIWAFFKTVWGLFFNLLICCLY